MYVYMYMYMCMHAAHLQTRSMLVAYTLNIPQNPYLSNVLPATNHETIAKFIIDLLNLIWSGSL